MKLVIRITLISLQVLLMTMQTIVFIFFNFFISFNFHKYYYI